MAIIHFPAPFLKKTNTSSIEVSSGTLLQCLEQVSVKFPDVKTFIFSNNQLAPFVKIFINRIDSSKLSGLNTIIKDEDELQIVLAVAGG